MHDTLSRNPRIIEKANGINHVVRLWTLYRITHPVAYIIDSAIPPPAATTQKYNTYYQYLYSSMQVMVQNENRGQGLVQIRTNYN